MKKFAAFLLTLSLTLSLCACGAPKSTEGEADTPLDYAALSQKIYDENLGEFADAYALALAEKDDISLRYGLMAVAEAKFLESAVFMPLYAVGGAYSMSYEAPYSVPEVLWGMDFLRHGRGLTVENGPITASDREEMLAQYAVLKGSGTYFAWAKDYLAGKGYILSDYYGRAFSATPTCWDIFNTYLTLNYDAIVNTLDMLMEYDCEGTLQPALAESYTVSEDGLRYTFKLREDAKWFDYQGRELGSVTADDFVCGMQHLLDCRGGTEYLAGAGGAKIVNADAYLSGEVTDFSQVGVKALDTFTVEYTLTEENPYFMTLLTMSVMAPLNRAFYTSQGGAFGAEYDASAADYLYASDYEHIAYCGAYLISSFAADNSVVFTANPDYYASDEITIKTIRWYFTDGSDPLKEYNLFKSGELSELEMGEVDLENAKKDGWFDRYAFVSETDATCYGMFTNINRQAFANSNDPTKAVSAKTEEQREVSYRLMNNRHFRRAIFCAFDRGTYNAQAVGEELKYAALVNSYVPGNFVSLTHDITLNIGGEDVTFAAGTYYGEMVQRQLDADGFAIKVWDEDANGGLGSSAGFDGWYDPALAMSELETALAELGIEATAEDPIVLDLPVDTTSTNYFNKGMALKLSVEKSLEGRVIINTVECAGREEWFYAGYYSTDGTTCNYDIYDVSGWGPDYGDPMTYLNAFYGENGDLTPHLGIF